MRVKVTHSIDDLADDMQNIAVRAKADLHDVVDDTRLFAEKTAKGFAREGAGPHGKAYHKRISSEMTGPLTAEIGPTGSPKSEFVGVGFRHGVNTDLPRTADLAGPHMAAATRNKIDRWFW